MIQVVHPAVGYKTGYRDRVSVNASIFIFIRREAIFNRILRSNIETFMFLVTTINIPLKKRPGPGNIWL